jgi:hypothetical protein
VGLFSKLLKKLRTQQLEEVKQSATCSVCGDTHQIEEIELCCQRPDIIAALPMENRDELCRESDDLCALWGAEDSLDRYFIRGIIPLSVHERHEPYNLGVWVEIPKLQFDRYLELWDSEDVSTEPMFEGTLANQIPFHKVTTGLQVTVRFSKYPSRPTFHIEPTDHSLYLEQIRGISTHQAHMYTSLVT